MSGAETARADDLGPWNPGLRSDIPPRFLHLSSIFRPENVSTQLEEVLELRELTGIEYRELVVFRPSRLILHEVLIRITADWNVPAGNRVEDLGLNFRAMVDALYETGLRAEQAPIEAEVASIASKIDDALDHALSAAQERQAAGHEGEAKPAGFLQRLGLGRKALPEARPAVVADSGYLEQSWDDDDAAIEKWTAMLQQSSTTLERQTLSSLLRVVAIVRARLGGLSGHANLLRRLAHGLALEPLASRMIGEKVGGLVDTLATRLGYRRLPAQAAPVVLNTKGASASGKSTLRLKQRELVQRMGVDWDDFALISPDIWRKYLLDYASLEGEAARYAGSFTGLELEAIDRKLDRYMASKAEQGRMTHLLIDRFRFDSFAVDSNEAGSNLLTRFGSRIFMFFMVTPPEETVVRAWYRGLEFGRFKSVDDLLSHNIEAYTGMPELFFTWALSTDREVQYEFLDNSVPKDQRPKTIAFGRNGRLFVLDVRALLNISRYRRVQLHAKSAETLYPDSGEMAVQSNLQFLQDCIERMPQVMLLRSDTGNPYAEFKRGRLHWCHPDYGDLPIDSETREALSRWMDDGVVRFADGGVSSVDPAPAADWRSDPEAIGIAQRTLGDWAR